jgi:hypothetical protein
MCNQSISNFISFSLKYFLHYLVICLNTFLKLRVRSLAVGDRSC